MMVHLYEHIDAELTKPAMFAWHRAHSSAPANADARDTPYRSNRSPNEGENSHGTQGHQIVEIACGEHDIRNTH
jgi:hypothetical protein